MVRAVAVGVGCGEGVGVGLGDGPATGAKFCQMPSAITKAIVRTAVAAAILTKGLFGASVRTIPFAAFVSILVAGVITSQEQARIGDRVLVIERDLDLLQIQVDSVQAGV